MAIEPTWAIPTPAPAWYLDLTADTDMQAVTDWLNATYQVTDFSFEPGDTPDQDAIVWPGSFGQGRAWRNQTISGTAQNYRPSASPEPVTNMIRRGAVQQVDGPLNHWSVAPYTPPSEV